MLWTWRPSWRMMLDIGLTIFGRLTTSLISCVQHIKCPDSKADYLLSYKLFFHNALCCGERANTTFCSDEMSLTDTFWLWKHEILKNCRKHSSLGCEPVPILLKLEVGKKIQEDWAEKSGMTSAALNFVLLKRNWWTTAPSVQPDPLFRQVLKNVWIFRCIVCVVRHVSHP